MNNFAKVVVSTTLARADWQNSRLINGNAADEIAALKRQPGRSINVSGSPTLIRWLLGAGLLDQLDLLVFPIVVGQGARLFDRTAKPQAFSIAQTNTFDNGVLHLTYRPT